jgi:triphosphoribosyl-dephospho-CoA synthetase
LAEVSEKRAALEYLENEDNLSELDIIFLDMILDEGTGFDILALSMMYLIF